MFYKLDVTNRTWPPQPTPSAEQRTTTRRTHYPPTHRGASTDELSMACSLSMLELGYRPSMAMMWDS